MPESRICYGTGDPYEHGRHRVTLDEWEWLELLKLVRDLWYGVDAALGSLPIFPSTRAAYESHAARSIVGRVNGMGIPDAFEHRETDGPYINVLEGRARDDYGDGRRDV